MTILIILNSSDKIPFSTVYLHILVLRQMVPTESPLQSSATNLPRNFLTNFVQIKRNTHGTVLHEAWSVLDTNCNRNVQRPDKLKCPRLSILQDLGQQNIFEVVSWCLPGYFWSHGQLVSLCSERSGRPGIWI